jgi:hypothetical protein
MDTAGVVPVRAYLPAYGTRNFNRSFYASPISNSKKQTPMKKLIFAALCLLVVTGCTHERQIWKNVYIQIDPAHQEEIQVKFDNGAWITQPNGAEFHVELKTWTSGDTGEKMYSVTYAGPVRVYAAYFSGFNNLVWNKNGAVVEDISLELPYDYKRQFSFRSTGRLKEAEVYELSVSEYLLE